ncbi:MAG: 3-dehydroquinate dehydratase [Bacteroidales bacterium]|nr:3-dehydroquinate dehydratase [Bacteroidales bacterium]
MTKKKNILIINGANLNLLGKRETTVYGNKSFEDYLKELRKEFKDCRIDYFQSNIEGEIVDQLQSFHGDAVIINAGGYTHTSVVIRDAIQYRTDRSNVDTLDIFEVHISNIYSREEFRRTSLLSSVCNGSIIGFGLLGYKLAVLAVLNKE